MATSPIQNSPIQNSPIQSSPIQSSPIFPNEAERRTFLGFEFQPLTLEALKRLKPILEKNPQPLSAFTIPCLAAWSEIYDYRIHFGPLRSKAKASAFDDVAPRFAPRISHESAPDRTKGHGDGDGVIEEASFAVDSDETFGDKSNGTDATTVKADETKETGKAEAAENSNTTEESFALISLTFSQSGEMHLFQPIGSVPPQNLEAIRLAASTLPYPLRILGCSAPFLEAHPDFAAHCHPSDHRDMANYLYATSDLATLAGRRFAKKRNLIAQAQKIYSWQTRELTATAAADCRHLAHQVADEDHRENRTLSWNNEMRALDFALTHWRDLDLRGTGIFIDGQLAAFALWIPNGPNMAVVHFERALRRWKGLYQVVNQETAKSIASHGLTLINREEDAGEPGLRHSKLSYFPLRLQPSISLTLKPSPLTP